MKVYILIEHVFTIDTNPYAEIIGVYRNKQEAQKKQNELIKNNIEYWDFVEDTEEHENYKIIFYSFAENWDNYIEYRIIEKEIL